MTPPGVHRNTARVYLIGDSTLDVALDFVNLLREGYGPFLQTFLSDAARVLRSEVAALPSTHRLQFPRFSSVQDLVALQQGASAGENKLHPALHKALVCCSHLAAFISQVGGRDDIFAHQDADVYLIGFCTGSLAAAAISCSRDIVELSKLARHAIRVAFRTAFRAYEIGQMIEEKPGSRASWSCTVTNLTEDEVQAAIDGFSNDEGLPITSRPYISFVGKDVNCITISGPPSILKTFRETKLTGGHVGRITDLDIFVPYHAKHLFTSQDVDFILQMPTSQSSNDHWWSPSDSRLRVISASTGAPRQAGNFRNHLYDAVEDILINRVRWDDIITGVSYLSLFSSPNRAISLRGVGTSYHTHLQAALSKKLKHNLLSSFHKMPNIHVPPSSLTNNNPFLTPSGRSKIAIIATSGRFPGPPRHSADLWSLLSSGLDVHSTAPPSRWDIATHVDTTTPPRKNTSRTPYGCWLSSPGEFDAKFFSITPREAPQIDPAGRLALMTAYEAMEQAGLVVAVGSTTPTTTTTRGVGDRVGVVYGVTSNDWMEANSAQAIDAYFIPGGCRAFVPGRVSYALKLGGPSLSVDTACSSSISAVHTACNLLWQGDVDAMIVGGTNVLTNPDYTAGLDRAGFLSRTGGCKSFCDTADGYCRAEGVVSMVLKRLEDAVADKDPILGVILGVGTNHSANAESITRPLAEAQKDLFERVLRDAGVSPLDVGYVEMHGTGTQAGDQAEMESVADTFAPSQGPLSGLRGKKEPPLYVGTVKANIGHQESAAGVTSLEKVLLMMKHDAIPPHVGIKAGPNKKFPADLVERGVIIPMEMVEWKRGSGGKPRRAFINNFSAAGGNSALLIEDAPPLEDPVVDTAHHLPATQVITVSAKTIKSLRGNIESLVAFLSTARQSDSLILPRISYTTTARRTHHPLRVAICASTLQDAQFKLQKTLEQAGASMQKTSRSSRGPSPPRVLFTFTGNGSQYSGMGRQLINNFPSFRADVLRFNTFLQREGFRSILPYLTATDQDKEENDEVVAQASIVCLEIALAHLWISWGVKPDVVIGHSLGEYAALALTGVLSDADAIYLVARRAVLLRERCSSSSSPERHGMLAIRGATRDTVQQDILACCRSGHQTLEIACVNGPEQVVVSGSIEDLVEFKKRLPEKLTATLLRVPYAFHSAQVEPILDQLETLCRRIAFREPRIPVISPLLGTTIRPGDSVTFNSHYLRRHCRETVDFLGAMVDARASALIDDRIVTLEIGPHPVINGMIRSIFAKGEMAAVLTSLKQGQDAFSLISPSLCALYQLGVDINWREYHSAFPASHRVVQLPTYSWDLKDYWIQYVNDWSLWKGDPPLVAAHKAPSSPPVGPVIAPLESTSIHKVIEDKLKNESNLISVIVETDLTRHDIRPLAQGHRVNGIPLSTPSIYVEIALRIGKHITDKYPAHVNNSHGRELVMSIQDMVIEQPLVVPDDQFDGTQTSPTILRSSVLFHLSTSSASCEFATTLDDSDKFGRKQRRHSHCSLVFLSRPSSLAAHLSNISTVQSRLSALSLATATTGGSYRFSNTMIYKMVGSLAQFEFPYRQVRDIILDSEAMDASSTVFFDEAVFGKDFVGSEDGEKKKKAQFYAHPAAVDALTQSAGFIMNANEKANLDREVFVNHGWERFQQYEKLRTGRRYVTYCHMVEKENKRWEGDCIVLDGEEDDRGDNAACPSRVVAWFGKIHLQGVPRRLLAYILSGEVTNTKDRFTVPGQGGTELELAAVKQPERPVDTSTTTTTRLNPITIPSASATLTTTTTAAADDKTRQAVLQILSEETGISIDELGQASSITLADLGIDSLLQLLIAGRLSEDLGFQLDSSKLLGISTVQDVCHLVAPPQPSTASACSSSSSLLCSSLGLQQDDLLLSPASPASLHGRHSTRTSDTSNEHNPEYLPVDEDGTSRPPTSANFSTRFITHLQPSSAVARAETNANLITTEPKAKDTSSSKNNITPSSHGSSQAPRLITTHVVCAIRRPATSIILSGRPLTDPNTLFLLPDGSGRATSYLNLASHLGQRRRVAGGGGAGGGASDLAVIGLNCPYAHHADEIMSFSSPSSSSSDRTGVVSLASVMDAYISEIRRRQAKGPYHLGGWSSGGILAYLAAQRLVREGEVVQSLLLIDAPAPTRPSCICTGGDGKAAATQERGRRTNGRRRPRKRGLLDPLPESWYKACTKAGVFKSLAMMTTSTKQKYSSSSSSSEMVLRHFRFQMHLLQSVDSDALDPLPEGYTPRTCIIWAGEACVYEPDDAQESELDRDVFDSDSGVPGNGEREGGEDWEGIDFLTKPRTEEWIESKSAGYWAELLPGERPKVTVLRGRDHFGMMRSEGGGAEELARWVGGAVLK